MGTCGLLRSRSPVDLRMGWVETTRSCRACGGKGCSDNILNMRGKGRFSASTCMACNGTGREKIEICEPSDPDFDYEDEGEEDAGTVGMRMRRRRKRRR